MPFWCLERTVPGDVVSALPVLAFGAFVVANAKASFTTLQYAGSNLLWICYGSTWIITTVSMARTIVALTSGSPLAWNILAIVQSFSLLLIQVCIVFMLFHNHLGWPHQAVRRSVGAAMAVAGSDTLLRSGLMFGAGIPLYYIRMCVSSNNLPPPDASVALADHGQQTFMPNHQILDTLRLEPSMHPTLESVLVLEQLDQVTTDQKHRQLREVLGMLLQRHQQVHPDMHASGDACDQGAGVVGMLHAAVRATMNVLVHGVNHAVATLNCLRQPLTASNYSDHLTSHAYPSHNYVAHVTDEPGLSRRVLHSLEKRATSVITHAWQLVLQFLMWEDPVDVRDTDCLNKRWAAWSYLLTYSLLLLSTYVVLLLLPATPLRGLLPARRALRTYLSCLCTTYFISAIGALTAGCGLSGGACVWALAQWLLQVGLGPLVYMTFLKSALSGSAHADGLDEDLLMYREMRDAGILDEEEDMGYS